MIMNRFKIALLGLLGVVLLLTPKVIADVGDVSDDGYWRVTSDGTLQPKTDSATNIGADGTEVLEIWVDSIKFGDGTTATGASALATPMEDQGTYVRIAGDEDIKLYDSGAITITGTMTAVGGAFSGDMQADMYTMENAAVLDNAADGVVTLTEGGSELELTFDGTDVIFDVDTGGIKLLLTDNTNGDFALYLNNINTDGLVFTQTANKSVITATGAGNDLYFVATGGVVDFDDDTIQTSGAISCGSISGFTSMTLGDDVLSLSTNDTLEWKSNDENSYFLISGHTGKDAVLSMASNDSGTTGQQWNIVVDYTDDNLEFFNETTELITFGSGGNIDMVTGTTFTMGNDEYIKNNIDGMIQIGASTDMILEVYSSNASDGDATLSLQGDAAGDVMSRWDLICDTGANTLIFKADSGAVNTMITKMTLSSTGNLDIEGDLDITGNDITTPGDLTITPAGNEIFIDAGVCIGGTTAVGDDNLQVDGTTLLVGATTITGDLTVNGGDFTMSSSETGKPIIDLTSTYANTSVGSTLYLSTDKATQADGDDCGYIVFEASDSAGNQTTFVTIKGEANDVGNGDEAGKLSFNLECSDADIEYLTMFSDTGGGSTGHVEFNSSGIDIDFTVDSLNQTGLFHIDGAEDEVVITSTSTARRNLFINADGATGTSGKAALVIDSENADAASLYITSMADASGGTSQIDDYAVTIVQEDVGGGLSVYRNKTGASEPLVHLREVHAASTAELLTITSAADNTSDNDLVSIQATDANFDDRLLFINADNTSGGTLKPVMEIDSQVVDIAALILRAPVDATGTDGDFDDYVMGISVEGIGGGLHIHRDVNVATSDVVTITDDNAGSTGRALFVLQAANIGADDPAVEIQTSSIAFDQSTLFINRDTTTGATGQAALKIDSEDPDSAALYITSANDASGGTAQIDKYAICVVAEGVGGGLSVYRDIASTTEALVNIKEVNQESTAKVLDISTGADDTNAADAVTITISHANFDKRALFIDVATTTGATLMPAMEIDSEATGTAALLIRSPVTLTGSSTIYDEHALVVHAEGVGGAAQFYRITNNPTGALVKIHDDLTDITSGNVNTLLVICDGDGDVDDAVVEFTTTNAAHDQPVLQITQAGTGHNLLLDGIEPRIVIGDGGDEDAILAFDGQTNDFYIGFDTTDDLLNIGVGDTPGTTCAIEIDASANVIITTSLKTPYQIVAATETLDEHESMKLIVLSHDDEFVTTLPLVAVSAGVTFHIVIGDAPEGVDYTVVTPGEDTISGLAVVNGASVPADTEDTITFTAGAAVIGDWVELTCDGNLWYVSGQAVAATGIVFTKT